MLNGEVIWQANDSSFLKSTHAFSLSLLRFLSLPFSSSLSFSLPLTFSVSFYALRTVWPDLAKFHHFGKMSKVFGNFLER